MYLSALMAMGSSTLSYCSNACKDSRIITRLAIKQIFHLKEVGECRLEIFLLGSMQDTRLQVELSLKN